ncbi:unnamed protein product [Ectocarpus sp. 12 AP-2014]
MTETMAVFVGDWYDLYRTLCQRAHIVATLTCVSTGRWDQLGVGSGTFSSSTIWARVCSVFFVIDRHHCMMFTGHRSLARHPRVPCVGQCICDGRINTGSPAEHEGFVGDGGVAWIGECSEVP